ncbi:MAG: NRDE family protein [Myxococcota bacterium]
MCLLAVLSRVRPDAPLVVAANRDELLARPTTPMAVLRADPRVLGGRDDLAGGTWLAVNHHGVVAGLTNRPNPSPDRTRRSRGELPLALAGHRDARSAVEAFRREVRPSDYNAAWLLVGDRHELWYVDLTGGDAPTATELPPGVHVLENRPLGADSPKAEHVGIAVAEASSADDLPRRLRRVLADHAIPARARLAGDPFPPIETQATCVHAGPYGTRSAAIVVVPATPGPPSYAYTDGPPCASAWHDATPMFHGRGG